ncbi:uncharacterized protein [Rutidosis leptorrhynchoides]|uniref:uncharacterized protein n=1 Tax=Rutidosis leptorrhynchoides TaxID=125765 RepID=UPI003A9A2B44
MPTAVSSLEEDLNSPNHPLYLHQNDHPGLILISKKLTGSDNYSSWRRSMMITLNAKNKLKIVTGDIIEPAANSPVKALWERTNDMIISWILNTITDQIGNSLNFVNNAAELWRELHEHYSQLDGHRIYQLTNEITQLKQDSMTVEAYYQKLKGYWDEMDALEALYICTCTCNCENGKTNGERDQRKRLIQFLIGLDECYTNVRGQILLMQPMPNAAKAYGMVRQEEKQKEHTSIRPTISAALSMQTNNTSIWGAQKASFNNKSYERKGTFKKGIFSGNCSLEGHTKGECYKVDGYPIGHSLHDKFKPPMKTSNYSKPVKSINAATTGNDGDSSNSNEMAMNARMDQLQNQLNQVLLMMKSNNTIGIHKIASHISVQQYRFIASIVNHLKDAWVVDSGATDHVSTSLSNMHNVHTYHKPIFVTLPNGHNTQVTNYGSVTINSAITLHDVLYIPSFSYNLLSVSKLGKDLPLSVLFTPLSCYFQDHNKRIAHGTLCNALYHIQQVKTSPQRSQASINQLHQDMLHQLMLNSGTQDLATHLFMF